MSALEEARRQHPEETEEQLLRRIKYRQHHIRKRRIVSMLRNYFTPTVALIIVIVIAAYYSYGQSPTVNLDRIGGTKQSGANVIDVGNSAIKVNVVAGGAGGGAAQLQVRNSGDSAWVNVGFNVANLTLPVTLQAGSAVIGHIICDSGCGGAASFGDNSAFTAGSTSVNIIGGWYSSSPSACTSGSACAPSLTSDRKMFVNAFQATGSNLHVQVDAAPTTAVTGTFWQATQPVSGTFWQATQPISGTVTAIQGTGSNLHVAVDSAPSTAVTGTFWQATQPVSGTFWQATQPVSGTVTITPPTLTKGTQGATGLSTQNLKDAGRTYVTLRAALITGVTTEALATFTKNVNGTDTTAQTAYTITSGKTFRIQSLSVIINDTTTVANNIVVNVRVAASVSATSPMVLSCGASAPVAVATAKGFANLSVPDGVDIPGNGSIQIGLSHLENVTTASIASFVMTGFEY